MKTNKRLVIALTAALALAGANPAFSNYFCSGKVGSVTVSPGGQVTLHAPEAGANYNYLCILGQTTNGISSDACKGILSTLLTAKATGRTVQFAFDDNASCTTRGSWVWMTGWYWGPELLGD